MDYAGLYPSKEFQMKWLRKYLEVYREREEVLEDDVESLHKTVKKFALSVRLFWGNWALFQAQNVTLDFDFLSYATKIFDEYNRRKNEFLSQCFPKSAPWTTIGPRDGLKWSANYNTKLIFCASRST